MEQFDHLEAAKEAVMILRGDHPAWHGDRILNSETFLRRIGRDFRNGAAFADDLRGNAADYSTLTGVSPDRIVWMANRVMEGVNGRH